MISPPRRLAGRFVAALTRGTPPVLHELAWPAIRVRTCVACGHRILDNDAFLRYRGEYYHAGPCLENDPPALRRRSTAVHRAVAGRHAKPA